MNDDYPLFTMSDMTDMFMCGSILSTLLVAVLYTPAIAFTILYGLIWCMKIFMEKCNE